jgi:hypothetical protein
MTQKLQDELLEVEGKIQEILSLIREDWIDSKLEKARNQRDKHYRDMNTAYILERKKAAVRTTLHTHSLLSLGDALRTKIKLCQYGESLEDALGKLSEQRVNLLERILESHLKSKTSADC